MPRRPADLATRELRRQRIEALVMDDAKRSNAAIAAEALSDRKTVSRIRGELERARRVEPRMRPVPTDHGGALLKPAGPGNDRAVRHGAWSERRLQPRADELAEQLREVVPGRAVGDDTVIRLLALTLARIEVVTAWLDEHGLFKDARGNPWPIVKNLSAWENTAGRLCDQLGLSPTARARLGVVKPGLDGYAAFLEALKDENAADPEAARG